MYNNVNDKSKFHTENKLGCSAVDFLTLLIIWVKKVTVWPNPKKNRQTLWDEFVRAFFDDNFLFVSKWKSWLLTNNNDFKMFSDVCLHHWIRCNANKIFNEIQMWMAVWAVIKQEQQSRLKARSKFPDSFEEIFGRKTTLSRFSQ